MMKRASQDARKKDTRDKIELGGLIIKAGLRYEKRALLLGLLLDAKARLDPIERARLTELGAREFGNDGKDHGAATAAGSNAADRNSDTPD